MRRIEPSAFVSYAHLDDQDTHKITTWYRCLASKVAQLTGAPELTGTGDAQLFGFFTTNPASLAVIDVGTAKASGIVPLPGVSTGQAFAFSFWGGDFWFYTAQGLEGSNVTRLKTATDRSISVVKTDIGFRIVGAGVSTCAPTAPPK